MKSVLIFLSLLVFLNGCGSRVEESPLILPPAAEPSAKMHNDRGIRYFQEGDYDDALLQFIQARTADATAGEIHFNLALVRIQLGEEDKVPEHLQLAKRYADDNPRILNSPLLKKYLAGNPG